MSSRIDDRAIAEAILGELPKGVAMNDPLTIEAAVSLYRLGLQDGRLQAMKEKTIKVKILDWQHEAKAITAHGLIATYRIHKTGGTWYAKRNGSNWRSNTSLPVLLADVQELHTAHIMGCLEVQS